MFQLVNYIRYYHYMAIVLEGQMADPLCGKCKALANTAARTEEGLAELESGHAGEIKDLPGDIRHLLAEARSKLATLKVPETITGQKKAGNCKMPEGVCFVKASKAILERIY
ncbi:MAG: hypothetical protein ACOYW7_09705 [Nitrospirota bacterium]